MKKMLLITLLLVGITNFAVAGSRITAPTTINRLLTYPGVAVVEINQNTTGCTFSNKHYVILDVTKASGKFLYSALLTAFTAHAKVRIGYNGCRSWWGATLPKVYRVDMVK